MRCGEGPARSCGEAGSRVAIAARLPSSCMLARPHRARDDRHAAPSASSQPFVAADRDLAGRTSELAAVAAALDIRRTTATASSSTRRSISFSATTTGRSTASSSSTRDWRRRSPASTIPTRTTSARRLPGVPEPVEPAPQRHRHRRAAGSAGLRVVDVFPGSPAARAGLTRGDVIVQVGASTLANRSADFASRLIKGRAGTRVTLTVRAAESSADLDHAREPRRPGREQQLLTLPRHEDRLRAPDELHRRLGRRGPSSGQEDAASGRARRDSRSAWRTAAACSTRP